MHLPGPRRRVIRFREGAGVLSRALTVVGLVLGAFLMVAWGSVLPADAHAGHELHHASHEGRIATARSQAGVSARLQPNSPAVHMSGIAGCQDVCCLAGTHCCALSLPFVDMAGRVPLTSGELAMRNDDRPPEATREPLPEPPRPASD